MSSTVGLYRDVVRSGEVDDNGTTVTLKAGQRVFCDLTSASRDPVIFPEPQKVDLGRAVDSYIHYGVGPHECLGKGLSLTGLTTMLKMVGRLKNLRRAPGLQGQEDRRTARCDIVHDRRSEIILPLPNHHEDRFRWGFAAIENLDDG